MIPLRKYTQVVETELEVIYEPFKPYLAILARVLLVSTFLEDSVRLMYDFFNNKSTQWDRQVKFLSETQGFGWLMAELFLTANIFAMVLGLI